MTTYPLRFTHNQIGTIVEYFKDGDWRSIQLIRFKDYNYCRHQKIVSEWIKYATLKGFEITKSPKGYTLTVPSSMITKGATNNVQ